MRSLFVCLSLLVLAGCTERAKAPSGAARPEGAGPVGATGDGPLVGQWTGELPAADAAARRFTLALRKDNTAMLRTEVSGKGLSTETGTWSADGKAVTIMITDHDGKPVSTFLAYDLEGEQLVPSQGWDSTAWGAVGPPKLAKR